MKRRLSKTKTVKITPEAVAAFEAGDRQTLHHALGLRPWEPNPLEIDGPTSPAWASDGTAWSQAWPDMWTIRQELEAACRCSNAKQKGRNQCF
ncbi:hypothetical protein [Mesorhizobium sp. dw_380]|uniref:hypothetical protein n=1 Tax=Mesorhizobium sp. dw_380 TaxID=2812001 RepID=UPI001BDEC6DF|nr:hypothetical protein [Mesorhizobium sp. dw_380]